MRQQFLNSALRLSLRRKVIKDGKLLIGNYNVAGQRVK